MIAVDTNILVRLFSKDDAIQHEKAKQVFIENDIFISVSVILETEWVLRFVYGLNRSEISEIFETLINSENINIGENDALIHALSLFRIGLDFADALHLSLSEKANKFMTFDKNFSKATPSNHIPQVELV
jgi:predicted nucleic-acid-binding protein